MEGNVNGDALPTCLASFVDNGTQESHRYFLARRTLLEMLRDRGYAVPDSEINHSLQEFRNIYGQNPDIDRLRISAARQSDPSDKILVIFCGQGVVKVNVIRCIAGMIINKDGLNGLILVVQNRITSQAMKTVELFQSKVEIFQITDLLVNITQHVLKPKHQVLTDVEKRKLLEKYRVEEKQLPRMLEKDAIARYFGLKKGQVVKVVYDGEGTGLHVTYRCIC